MNKVNSSLIAYRNVSSIVLSLNIETHGVDNNMQTIYLFNIRMLLNLTQGGWSILSD